MNKWFKIICISLLVLGLLSFAYPVLAQNTRSSSVCRNGNTHCEYPGECHDYTDSNNDGYCDRSASATVNSNTVSPATSGAGDGSSSSSTPDASGAADAENNQNKPGAEPGYNLLLIFIIVGVMYTLSYVLSLKKVMTTVVHRKIWNAVLLVSAVAMLVLGLLLTLRVDYSLNILMPFDMKFWHVETGIIMGIIAVFHICWHWRYYAGLLKKVSQTHK